MMAEITKKNEQPKQVALFYFQNIVSKIMTCIS